MKQDFRKELEAHDWYYDYSDDHNAWNRGKRQLQSLKLLHSSTYCPFDISQLRKWATGMVIDRFSEEEPGQWYQQPRGEYASSVTYTDLLSTKESQEIESWFK
jgi:hypothetical protein